MEPDNKEWQAPGNHVPKTKSSGDHDKWEEQKAEMSRRRLSDLEERLERIEKLKARLSRVRAKHGDMEKKPQTPHACLTLPRHLPGQCEQTIQDVENVDFDRSRDFFNKTDFRGDATPDHHRPETYYRNASFTPNMSGLRTIIREEVAHTFTRLMNPDLRGQLTLQKRVQSTEERPGLHKHEEDQTSQQSTEERPSLPSDNDEGGTGPENSGLYCFCYGC